MKHVQATRYVMGTFLTIRVHADDVELARQALDVLFQKVQRLETVLSRFRPDSEISRINQSAGIASVCVTDETYRVIEQALHFADDSNGVFDPTIQSAAYRQVVLNPKERSVFLPIAGMTLDLGGIGKGFALDEALAAVRGWPYIRKVFMDFGGQLLFWTPEGTFEPETVAIENPQDRNKVLTTFQVRSNCSVATSSNAEQAKHIWNSLTGNAENRIGSATVIAPTATEAEGLSTALFILDAQAGAQLLAKYPTALLH